MRKKKVKYERPTLDEIIDIVWTMSQSSSTPEEKEAADAQMKRFGMYFAKPIHMKPTKPEGE
jgi:hypothetical protein